LKLLSYLKLHKGCEPTALYFLNGYNILMIGTNESVLYLLKCRLLEENKLEIDLLSIIDTKDIESNQLNSESN